LKEVTFIFGFMCWPNMVFTCTQCTGLKRYKTICEQFESYIHVSR